MTARQQAFIARLVGEKQLPDGERADAARAAAADASYFRTAAAASQCIDWLLSLPRAASAAPAPNAPTVEVPAGRYALVQDDGTVKFYTVDRPTDGRWAGYTFVNAMGSDTRYPIRNRQARDEILTAIAADPFGAMSRYGQELGHCGACGRALTDELSRAAGIGPDCADRHGIDRSVYADRAAAAAAARETGRTLPDGFPVPAVPVAVTVEEFQAMADAALAEIQAAEAAGERADGEDDGIVWVAPRREERKAVTA